MRFEVFTTVRMLLILVFRAVTPCSSVGGYQRLRGTYRFHLQCDVTSRRHCIFNSLPHIRFNINFIIQNKDYPDRLQHTPPVDY